MQHNLFRSAVLVLAGALTIGSVAAETAAKISNKSITAAVEIDGKLTAHPGLHADVLAEGRREIERMSREAQKERREEPEFFKDKRWTFQRSYTQLSVVGPYVSVLRSDDSYQGGAHPNLDLNTILWDRDARKRISIRPFFKETADNGPTMTTLAREARLAVAREKIARAKEFKIEGYAVGSPEEVAQGGDIERGIQPRILKLGPVALAPSTTPGKSAGLTFHYGRYAVGAYAEGEFEVFVHWSKFRAHLSPDGLAIFGGDRPRT
jgi:hypothetical protein